MMHRSRAQVSKILLVIGLVILLLASSNVPVLAKIPQTKPALSPLNPAFVQYMNDRNRGEIERTAEGYALGYIPNPRAPLPEASVVTRTLLQTQTTWTFTPSYDLRSLGKVTSVRDQNPLGTCWAFAAFGSMESSLLPSDPWDFSEDNLVLNAGFDTGPEGPYNHGGNYDMATAYLARWGGPVRQDEDAYGDSYTPPGLSPSKHIQEILYLPNKSGPTDNDLIKNALMTYGGVGANMWWSDGSFNGTYDSFYYSGEVKSNHAVVIVGWDDNYPASQFTSVPPGNGAFIVRNSWGTWFGQGGYFYISYYDSVFGYNIHGSEVAVYSNAELTTNYDRIYQYDPLGWTIDFGYSSTTAWFANAFTAGDGESLAAVSFYTPVANASYEIYSGGALSSKQFRKSGTIEFSGYHTIPLDSTVALPSGQGFVVAVKLTTGSNYPVALEYPYSGYSSQATAQPGQSYVSDDGTSWTDLTSYYTNANVCLKAFTTGGTPPPSHSVSITAGPAASPSTIASEGTTNLSVSASDSLGHSLNYSWSVVSSPLGDGLFSSATAQNPTWTAPANSTGSNQTVQLKVRASCSSDSSKVDEGTVNVTVQPPPTITLLFPNGGESWTVGESHAIQWSSANLSGNVKIELSRYGGSSWETLFAGTTNDGNQNWTVTGPASTTCRVRVTSVANGTVLDTSNANFAIVSAVHKFTLHLLANWNMISLPLTTSASPSAVFGGLPAGWMIFSWNPLIPGYLMNDQITLETGKGYWLKSPNAMNYEVSGEPFNQLKTVPLAVGWNMVGLPYLEDADWGDVHIRAGGVTYTLDQAADAGVITRYLFWLNGNQYQMANEVGKLEPGKGYWLQAKQVCELLFSPGGVMPPPPPPPGNP